MELTTCISLPATIRGVPLLEWAAAKRNEDEFEPECVLADVSRDHFEASGRWLQAIYGLKFVLDAGRLMVIDSESPVHAKLMRQIEEEFSTELKNVLAIEIPSSLPSYVRSPFYPSGTPWSPKDAVPVKPDFQLLVNGRIVASPRPQPQPYALLGEFGYTEPSDALERKCVRWGKEFGVPYVVALKFWKRTMTMTVSLFEDGVKQGPVQTVSFLTEEDRERPIALSFTFKKEKLLRNVNPVFMDRFSRIPDEFTIAIKMLSWEELELML